MSTRYWEVRFLLPGGWSLICRLLADDIVDASDKARASLKEHDIYIDDIYRLCAECTELNIETGARL